MNIYHSHNQYGKLLLDPIPHPICAPIKFIHAAEMEEYMYSLLQNIYMF